MDKSKISIFEYLIRYCHKCKSEQKHEHGLIRNEKWTKEVWVCVRCGKVTVEKEAIYTADDK